MNDFWRRVREIRWWGWAASLGVIAVTAVILLLMGREPWCPHGDPWWPFSWDVWSSHNSQHVLDPYSGSHMQHGLLFYVVLWLIFRGKAPSVRLILAVSIEAAWEILENTPLVINRYRESTASLDYYGDSVLNSVSDVGSCLIGYAIAAAVPWWATLGIFAVTEIGMLIWIRDSLILNVIMLIAPIQAIKDWQTGA